MIKLHPSELYLQDFAAGKLASAESVLVSAHCDLCHQCTQKIEDYIDAEAKTWLDEKYETEDDCISRDYIYMFESITNESNINPSSSPLASCKTQQSAYQSNQLTQESIHIDGKTFYLPDTLIRFTSKMGEWKHIVGKVWYANVDIDNGRLAQFIYMEKGAMVPEHTHEGHEFTLVIDGRFSDGLQAYTSGDFIALNNQHTHNPVCNVHEGCLVFSVIDEPLHFTTDWAKIINPLSHLHFKSQINT